MFNVINIPGVIANPGQACEHGEFCGGASICLSGRCICKPGSVIQGPNCVDQLGEFGKIEN